MNSTHPPPDRAGQFSEEWVGGGSKDEWNRNGRINFNFEQASRRSSSLLICIISQFPPLFSSHPTPSLFHFLRRFHATIPNEIMERGRRACDGHCGPCEGHLSGIFTLLLADLFSFSTPFYLINSFEIGMSFIAFSFAQSVDVVAAFAADLVATLVCRSSSCWLNTDSTWLDWLTLFLILWRSSVASASVAAGGSVTEWWPNVICSPE